MRGEKYLETTSPRKALLLAIRGGLNSVWALGKWEKAGTAIGVVNDFSVGLVLRFLSELTKEPILSTLAQKEMLDLEFRGKRPVHDSYMYIPYMQLNVCDYTMYRCR